MLSSILFEQSVRACVLHTSYTFHAALNSELSATHKLIFMCESDFMRLAHELDF